MDQETSIPEWEMTVLPQPLDAQKKVFGNALNFRLGSVELTPENNLVTVFFKVLDDPMDGLD